MLPWAAELHQKRKDSLSKDDPEARCLPPGVPRMSTTPYPWTMVQTPQLLVIVYEGGAHIWRKIFLGGRPLHDPKVEHTWLGDSIGHWEGDTLVVDTTNFNSQVRLRGSSENLHIIERFTRVDQNNILYRATIDDPTTFSKPWTVEYPFLATKGPIYEYACHEGNYAMTDILGGARKADEAKEKK
jgi:hypothetical protein